MASRDVLCSMVAGALLLTACGGEGGAGPSGVAAAFQQAAEAGDGGGACALLAPDVQESVSEDSGTPCPEAIVQEGIPAPSSPVRSQVFGRQAFVVTATDTVFLSQFPQGWRVIAAGCTPQGRKPYHCLVSGG